MAKPANQSTSYDRNNTNAHLRSIEERVLELHQEIRVIQNRAQTYITYSLTITSSILVVSFLLFGICVFGALATRECLMRQNSIDLRLMGIRTIVDDIRMLRLNSASNAQVAAIVERHTSDLAYLLRKELDRQNLCEAELHLVEYYEEAYNECNNKFAQPAIAIHQEPGTCPEREWS